MSIPNKQNNVEEAVENAMNIDTKPNNSTQKAYDHEKLTVDQEADLSVHEMEQMEWEHAQNVHKGSAGPEEKDIAV